MKGIPYIPPFTVPRDAYQRQIRQLVRAGLTEDIGRGDMTTRLLKLSNRKGRARLKAKQGGMLAGRDAFEATFRALDAKMKLDWREMDGGKFRRGSTIVTLSGRVDAILTGERTAINFLAHLSGIATATRRLVEKIPKKTARLLDTRKTMPGWRYLEKHATAVAGAVNHRLGLNDAVMLKDNHIAAVGGLEQAIRLAMASRSRKPVICEVRTVTAALKAMQLNVHWLLLDNMTTDEIQKLTGVKSYWMALQNGKQLVILEASGNITEENIVDYARSGVDFISSGAITHSAPSIDFSLEWVT